MHRQCVCGGVLDSRLRWLGGGGAKGQRDLLEGEWKASLGWPADRLAV